MVDILSEEDIKWLKTEFPHLKISSEEIFGELKFTATYNHEKNRFLRLKEGVEDGVGGICLDGKFIISIRPSHSLSFSSLPGLFLANIQKQLPDQHINQDLSACLCSPLTEDEFLLPNFQFIRYFEQLVIPFLYAQLFYTKENYWPWPDLSHGSLGLLESYLDSTDKNKARKCLQKLTRIFSEWFFIRKFLMESNPHMTCLCPGKKLMQICHIRAWQGLVQLKLDMISEGISIPG